MSFKYYTFHNACLNLINQTYNWTLKCLVKVFPIFVTFKCFVQKLELAYANEWCLLRIWQFDCIKKSYDNPFHFCNIYVYRNTLSHIFTLKVVEDVILIYTIIQFNWISYTMNFFIPKLCNSGKEILSYFTTLSVYLDL